MQARVSLSLIVNSEEANLPAGRGRKTREFTAARRFLEEAAALGRPGG